MNKDIRGIILAAGRGSRMGHHTTNKPKCRTILHGKELIEWQLEALNGAAIKNIAIIRGYLPDTFDFDVHYFDNKRWSKTNMVSSLISANEWLEKSICITSYSDIVYTKKSVEILINAPGDIVITYDPNWEKIWTERFDEPLSDAESFRIDNDSKVLEIGARVKDISQINGQYMGLVKYTPKGWGMILDYLSDLDEVDIDNLDMTSLLSNLIKSGIVVNGVPINEPWFEVDTESDLILYSKLEKLF